MRHETETTYPQSHIDKPPYTLTKIIIKDTRDRKQKTEDSTIFGYADLKNSFVNFYLPYARKQLSLKVIC